jgi:soluble lytic murein transglycosylase-like protein
MDEKTKKQLIEAAKAQAKAFELDPNLVMAIIEVESGWNPLKAIYYGENKLFVDPEFWAQTVDTTVETEKLFQHIDWGLMQVSGAVARELRYKGALQNLSSMWDGTELGCKMLVKTFEKFPDENDAIAAYGLGDVLRNPDTGRYVNQDYVDKVQRKLLELRKAK